MSWQRWAIVPLVLAPATAAATEYLTLEQAQRLLFPDAQAFVAVPIDLTKEQQKMLEKKPGIDVDNAHQDIWEARSKNNLLGYFVLDQVASKHELITYGVALAPDGVVRGLEIMIYLETRGGQIVDPVWRKQFTGKKFGDPLVVAEDIQNISGATISCQHVTIGLRRILALFHTFILGKTHADAPG